MVKRPQKPPIEPYDSTDWGDPTIPISHEKWIGRITVEWSRLEGTLDDLIWCFLDLPIEFGRTITTTMSATGKITMLRNLIALAFDPLLQDYLREHLDIVEILKDDRNFVVHGTWGRTLRDRTPMASSLRPKHSPSLVVAESFTAERLQSIWKLIISVKLRLVPLFDSATAAHRRAREKFQTINEAALAQHLEVQPK
jgi:hypothetical protein